MGGACGTHGEGKKCMQGLVRNVQMVDRRVILKWILTSR